MGRAPCCDKANVKKGPWSPEEDAKLKEYIEKQGTGGNWIALPQKAGLKRCGKSCRLRWLNYLRPNLKHGEFSDEEDRLICTLYASIGSRWSIIAAQLPGRTDNDIKNYWNTKLKKKPMTLFPSPPQRKLLHQAIINTASSPLFQDSSLPSSPPSTLLSCPYTLPRSFTEPISPFSPSSLSTSSLQPRESFVSPLHNYGQVKDSFLVLGADQTSCSSSDGSSNNNHQIGQAREIDQHDQYGGLEVNQKSLVLANCGGDVNGWSKENKQNGLWGDNPADYGFEEIKQLISTSTCSNFLFDANKAEEQIMYY